MTISTPYLRMYEFTIKPRASAGGAAKGIQALDQPLGGRLSPRTNQSGMSSSNTKSDEHAAPLLQSSQSHTAGKSPALNAPHERPHPARMQVQESYFTRDSILAGCL